MLCSISEASQDDAQRILSLICYASRPLSVSEVIEAVAVDIDNLQCYDQDLKLHGAADLLRICAGLIEISSSDLLNNDSDSKYGRANVEQDDEDGAENTRRVQLVRLGHFSVQEYLVSNRIKQGPAANFALSASIQHARISKTCVLYLTNEDFSTQTLHPQLVRQYSLARYAAQYWHDHYRQANEKSAPQLSTKVVKMLMQRQTLERWVRLYDVDRLWYHQIHYEEIAPTHGSPVYYAALLGFSGILADILSTPFVDVNAQGGFHGTALKVASFYGHEKVVQMLLDKGADVEAQGGAYETALQAASGGGNEKVVQLLLEKKVDIDAPGEQYGSALQEASARGHEKVVQLLLDNGANIEAHGGLHGNSLHVASRNGHEKVMQILLDRGADVQAQGGEYGTALQAASALGQEKLVQMLLDRGADVQAPGGRHGNALTAASFYGHEKVVQILLDKGADTQARGGEYSNALEAASAQRRKNVVQMLQRTKPT